MDVQEKQMCPLLRNPESYNPDTIDLLNNEEERNYWLPCLENMVQKFVNKAGALNPDNPAATEKAEICYQQFHSMVETATVNPSSSILNPLSVRTLLEFHEDNLRTNNFKDAWHSQKLLETKAALKDFNDRLNAIDSIDEFDEKWLELIWGVLGGNVFDWGATRVASILENSTNFGLTQAMNIIQKRPWFMDDLDCWIERIKEKSYEKAVIFVDNAGVDFILGILPLVREFLKNATKVVLTANSSPSLNDITYRELKIYCNEAAQLCPIIAKALNTGQLVSVENGQKGPCLDLTALPAELCKLMKSADLVLLEGMGRAVHTNLFAKFTVDCVKVATLKNEWLAKSLGAEQFSVIFSYEPVD